MVGRILTAPGTTPVRFYLTIGRLESGTAFNDGLISMVHASRHVRDVLMAKGLRGYASRD